MKKEGIFFGDKRGQQTMGLPFGLIFGIFMIVIFIIVAIIAINHFLNVGKCSSIGMFYEELQEEVNKAFSSQEYDNTHAPFEINLDGITRICFGNLSNTITNQEDYDKIKYYEEYDTNTFLIPPENACDNPQTKTEKLNITEITKTKNPYCVDTSRGLILKKEFFGKGVLIE